MNDYILPTMGFSGRFEFASPISDRVNPDEVYTCHGVRTIAEYASKNEDVQGLAYTENGLTEDQFLDDQEVDMQILSLQSMSGRWIYVPARFVVRYPDGNGVVYQSQIFTVALPPLPVDTNFITVPGEISEKIIKLLGVTPEIRIVRASSPTIFTSERDAAITAERAASRAGYVTHDVALANANATIESQREHIRQLEEFIKSKGL